VLERDDRVATPTTVNTARRQPLPSPEQERGDRRKQRHQRRDQKDRQPAEFGCRIAAIRLLTAVAWI